MIEVAKKGTVVTAILTLATLIVIGAVGYTILLVLNGYAANGAYGSLVVPTLLASVLSLWSLRSLIANLFAGSPLIFFKDDQLHYVAHGHASVSLTEIGSFDRGQRAADVVLLRRL